MNKHTINCRADLITFTHLENRYNMWIKLTFLCKELTILWNDLTIGWNDLTWNDLTMERNDRIPQKIGVVAGWSQSLTLLQEEL